MLIVKIAISSIICLFTVFIFKYYSIIICYNYRRDINEIKENIKKI